MIDLAAFQFDRQIPAVKIIDAFAAAFGISPHQVSVWPINEVDDRSAPVIIQTEEVGGDFPSLLYIGVSDSLDTVARADVFALAKAVTRSLPTMSVSTQSSMTIGCWSPRMARPPSSRPIWMSLVATSRPSSSFRNPAPSTRRSSIAAWRQPGSPGRPPVTLATALRISYRYKNAGEVASPAS